MAAARVEIFSYTWTKLASCCKNGKPRICGSTTTKSRRIYKGKSIRSPAVLQPTGNQETDISACCLPGWLTTGKKFCFVTFFVLTEEHS